MMDPSVFYHSDQKGTNTPVFTTKSRSWDATKVNGSKTEFSDKELANSVVSLRGDPKTRLRCAVRLVCEGKWRLRTGVDKGRAKATMPLHFVGLGEGFSDSGGAGQAGRVPRQLCSRRQCRSETLSQGPGAIGSLVSGETEGIKMEKGKRRVILPIASALSHSRL